MHADDNSHLKARDYFEQATRLVEEIWVPDHPELVNVLVRFGRFRLQLQSADTAGAEELLLRVLRNGEAVTSPPTTLSASASVPSATPDCRTKTLDVATLQRQSKSQ